MQQYVRESELILTFKVDDMLFVCHLPENYGAINNWRVGCVCLCVVKQTRGDTWPVRLMVVVLKPTKISNDRIVVAPSVNPGKQVGHQCT